jgi:putative spermidine/putrescine transport system permease protein
MTRRALAPWLLIGAPLVVFAALFLLPLANLAVLSLMHFDRTTGAIGGFSLDNYGKFLGDPFYLGILWRTFKLAVLVTLSTLVIGYPVAVYLSRANGRRRAYLTLVILAPLLISVVVRSFGWLVILGPNGLVNSALRGLSLIDEPLRLLYTETAITLGLVHVFLSFMVLSVATALGRIDPAVLRAAASLGAGPVRTFPPRRAAAQPARGGRRLGHRLHAERQRLHHAGAPGRPPREGDVVPGVSADDAPVGLALRRGHRARAPRDDLGGRGRLPAPARVGTSRRGLPVIARVSALGAWTTLVYAFILSPIAVILIASFTAADYTSFPPQGWSLRWYAEIPRHPEFLEALWVSLVVAAVSATLATILGTLAALSLVRYRFRGRALFNAFFLSPLMLPTVILGLALLQFYALVGITRTPASLVCGHLVITVPYVIRLVGAGLAGLDPSLERAAMSLGATPWRTFRAITLPLIGPGVAAGAAFAAIVSFDDVNIALFLASPRAPTLPVRIFTYIEQTFDPLVTAVCSVLILLTLAAIVVVERGIGLGRLFGADDG